MLKEIETPNEKDERNLRPEKIKQEQITNLRRTEENRDEIDKTVTDILSHLSKERELSSQVSEREIKKRRRQEEIIEKCFEEISDSHVVNQNNDDQRVPILSDEEFLDKSEVNKNINLRKKEDQKVIHQQQIEKRETESEEEFKNSVPLPENSIPFCQQDNQKQRQGKLNNSGKNLEESDDRQKEVLTPGSHLKKEKEDIEGDSKEAQEYKEQRKLKEIQNLIDLRDEFSSMPTCAEKSLLTLIYFASLLLIEPEYRTKGGLSIPERVNDKISKEFETLLCRIEKENLPIKTDNLKKYMLRAKNNDIKGMKEGLQAILKEIRPLNCQEVLRLVREGEKTADLVAGQDVVALFGKTGSGKSTTIHFLAGSKMKKITVDGENHIAPRKIIPQLEKVTTSPSDKSETQYITSVTINPADLGLWSNKAIIFLDTAGFGDTRGVEVDIANGLSIIKAIEKCKSVKIVILVSYKGNGDRFEGLKSLAHTLVV